MINLLKAKGGEGKLNMEYEKRVKSVKDKPLQYIYFDLHHHCGTTRFDKLSILLKEIDDNKYMESLGFFQSKQGKIIQEQKGTFRINCKDCLDRTNLVQGYFSFQIMKFISKISLQLLSLLARHSLVYQLINVGILKDENELEKDKNFMFFFRNIWADNGDALSTFYAGTGAIRVKKKIT